jgi:hypothetical protein
MKKTGRKERTKRNEASVPEAEGCVACLLPNASRKELSCELCLDSALEMGDFKLNTGENLFLSIEGETLVLVGAGPQNQ